MKKAILKECLRIALRRNTVELHSEYGRYHHFSFIVQNNTIIEYGTNHGNKNQYSRFYYDRSKVHAEACAYKKAKGLLSNEPFEIVNIRLSKSGDLRLSKPCICCVNFLTVVGATSVWFSTADGFLKETL